ncbi:colony stimulating factor 3 (granulocyte) a isoform X1 [Danio rerio]|uniref:Colony stimulating factor 3 (Granulocyte) a isoform X1 n=1 Tax=Danio rerio TaxID=7955 RepID=A0AC58GUL1_DANRE
MMGLCYYWSLVIVLLCFLIGVAIMNFQAAQFFFTLVGIVVSAPVPQKLDIMNKDTIEQAHSLISKTLEDIPATHAAWVKSKSLAWGSSTDKLQHLKHYIPSAPVLQNITDISSLETCLDKIVRGLQLHLNLLKDLIEATTLSQTDQVTELQADIQELVLLIEELQNQSGFNPSQQTSEEQSQSFKLNLTQHLKSDFQTEAAAHLILHQLRDFSCDILQRILSIRV